MPIIVSCQHCGAEFPTFPSRIKDGKGKFCSEACNDAFRHDPAYIAERFWTKVNVLGPDECWEWKASKINKGYGQFRIAVGVMESAHQFSFVLAYGPIPEGHYVCHTCDNPPCCNPKHLFPGTVQDNADDRVQKGRQLRGEEIGVSKLVASQVEAIRELYRNGATMISMEKQFNISDSQISNIVNRRSWVHIQ